MNLAKLQPPLNLEPACCRMCSAVSGRDWFIDLGYMEDFWGNVYYCNLCFAELAETAGYIPRQALKDAQEMYEGTLRHYRLQHWELSGALDLLRDAGFDVHSLYLWLRSVADGETNIEFPEREESLASGEIGSDESPDGERSDDFAVLKLDF